MLASIAKPVFVVACAANLAFSVMSGFALEQTHPSLPVLATVGGAIAFSVAVAMAFVMLRGGEGFDRPWIKAALVFLALGPLAFWGLQAPAAASVMQDAQTTTVHARAIGDVIQSQIAMIVVALAAVFCAARAMAAMLDDLAV
jgi:hypothetical protein